MMRKLFFAAMFAVTSTSIAIAQTDAEKAACRSDAIKFCKSDIGNPQAMFACLKQHKAELSQACLQVVEAHGG